MVRRWRRCPQTVLNPNPPDRRIIPGCGSGYEVVAFAGAGYAVTALDFSPPAIARARASVGPALSDRIVAGDFFTHDLPAGSFDLIYERTFWCALPPARWPEMAARTAALLKPDGTLAGLFYFGEKADGPPFGFSPGEPKDLFGPHFDLVVDAPVPAWESLPLYAGNERWQEWRRRE
jgi:SAM-dependent methyltransferase